VQPHDTLKQLIAGTSSPISMARKAAPKKEDSKGRGPSIPESVYYPEAGASTDVWGRIPRAARRLYDACTFVCQLQGLMLTGGLFLARCQWKAELRRLPSPSRPRYPPLQQFADLGGCEQLLALSSCPWVRSPFPGGASVSKPDTGDSRPKPLRFALQPPTTVSPTPATPAASMIQRTGASHFVRLARLQRLESDQARSLGRLLHGGITLTDGTQQQQQQQLLLLPPQVPQWGATAAAEQQRRAQVWGGSCRSSSGPMYAGYARDPRTGG